MRTLVITNLFPNQYEPRRGVFNFLQFSALNELCEVEVIAPSPRYPGMSLLSGAATSGRVAQLPDSDRVGGLRVRYPRYWYLPRVGQRFHPGLYYRGVRAIVQEAVKEFRPDVLLATWSYPDVVATQMLARLCGLPYVAKVHGTDINDYLNMPGRRDRIVAALAGARRVVAVSSALREVLVDCGIGGDSVDVVYNGVDRDLFHPRARNEAREKLGVATDAKSILFVGNLKEVKGVNVLLEALTGVDESVLLWIVGRGPLESSLRSQCDRAGLNNRVTFLGERDHGEIAGWMGAADLVCLPSRNEGVPNVLLEAMASGRPVVATRVGGIPEIVSGGETGVLVDKNDPQGLREALESALQRAWDVDVIVRRSLEYTWPRSAEKLHSALTRAIC